MNGLKWLLAGVLALIAPLFLSGCQSARPAIRTEEFVDLQRFMGDWYVLACIPTWVEKDAYNAVESYELRPDGTIGTTFTFRQGGFDGEEKTYTPRGFVRDEDSNAVWGMRFIWPFKADYRIVYVSDDYQHTIIGRQKRDYVWIMGRSPMISEEAYARLVSIVEEQGYDPDELYRVPQQW